MAATGEPVPRLTGIYGDGVFPRRHGFERPLDSWQIWGWGSIFAVYVCYFCLIGPLLEPYAAAFAVSAVMTVVALTTICLKIIMSLLPNEDPACYGPQLSTNVLLDRNRVPDGATACNYCRRWTDVTSRHCSVCDKCVVGFDHHCRWLNVCVGSRTYKPFIAFVTFVLLSLLLNFATALTRIIQCALDTRGCENRLRQMYGRASYETYIAFLVLLLLYLLAGCCVIGHLWGFHMWLIVTGRTTWDWIQEKRHKARTQREAQRQSASASPTAPAPPGPAPPGGGLAAKMCPCCGEKKRRDFKAENAAHKGAPPGTAVPAPVPHASPVPPRVSSFAAAAPASPDANPDANATVVSASPERPHDSVTSDDAQHAEVRASHSDPYA
jgi:hypothetical protein